MKELSIEEKAEAYERAVKEASIAYKDEDKHLKATLERIFPELKESTDWSGKDEEMLKMVIKSCEQCGNEYAYYWLKSLKDRVQPQSQWKPSDTEINILQGVIDGSFKPENVKVTLTNILEQLKKLREE